MSDRFEERVFPRREQFARALLRIVTVADRYGLSVKVEETKATIAAGAFRLEYELQLFGRTTIRRYHRGRLESRLETYDVDHGLDLMERVIQELA